MLTDGADGQPIVGLFPASPSPPPCHLETLGRSLVLFITMKKLNSRG